MVECPSRPINNENPLENNGAVCIPWAGYQTGGLPARKSLLKYNGYEGFGGAWGRGLNWEYLWNGND